MKDTYSPEEPNSNRVNPEDQKTAAADLRFMRSVVEKTHRQVKPDAHVIIMWGLICMICYTTVHFLMTSHLQKWILPIYLFLMAVGLIYTGVTLWRVAKREKEAGYIPQLPKQVARIWIIITLHVLSWSILGMLLNDFSGGDPAFLAAVGLSIGLSATGILHSREWLYGGIGIFIGILLTYFVKDYGYIILGLATGLGCIVPAIICQRKYNKQEKEDE
jgi:FtsH-binding integral membrane protein